MTGTGFAGNTGIMLQKAVFPRREGTSGLKSRGLTCLSLALVQQMAALSLCLAHIQWIHRRCGGVDSSFWAEHPSCSPAVRWRWPRRQGVGGWLGNRRQTGSMNLISNWLLLWNRPLPRAITLSLKERMMSGKWQRLLQPTSGSGH